LVQRRTGFRSPIFGLERLRRENTAYLGFRSRNWQPILAIAVVAFLLLDLVLVYALTREDDTVPRGLSPLGISDRSGQGGSSESAGVVGRDGTEVGALNLADEGQDPSTKSTDREQGRPAAHSSGGGSDSGSGGSATASSTSTSSSTGTTSSGGSIGGSSGSTGSGGSGSSGSGSGGSGSGGTDSGGSGSSGGGPGGSGGGGSGDGAGSGDGGVGGAGGGG
jgi:hypothetical protein